nr:ABC transporter, solute-binding protein [uncultured archaeon]
MKRIREKMKMRKGAAFGIIAVIVTAMLLASMPTVSANEELYGDANGDGEIDMRDVTYVGLIILGKKPETELADANQDDRVNVGDITYIELIILGEVSKYPLRLGESKSEFNQMSVFAKPWGDACFFGFTHVGLVVYKPDMSIAPGLAKDWEVAPDGKSIKFYLVENAKWHDGKPITAEDGAFNFEYWKKNMLWSQGRWYDSYLDHVDVLDDYTFEVFFTEPVAGVTLMTYIPATRFVPKHIWEEIEDPLEYSGSDALIGNGPFIFERCDKEAQVAYLKANRDYFAGKPSVDKIEWHYYRTLDTLLLALKKGEIDAQFDYYMPVPGVYAADLVKTENVELCVVPDVGTPLHLIFGYREYPTDVKEFRQAVSYAIDYQAIVDMIAAGYGEVAGKGYTPPTVPGHNPDLPKLEYNITKAEEILDNAGFVDQDGDGLREAPDGSKLQIPILPYPHIVGAVRAAEVIDRQLEKVGLDTSVEVQSWDIVREKVFWGDRDYYMVIGYATPFGNIAPPSGVIYFVDMPGLLGTCKDEELVSLVENIIHSKDIEEMESWVSEVQEYVAEEQPAIALIWGDAIYPYRSDKWEGWVPQ